MPKKHVARRTTRRRNRVGSPAAQTALKPRRAVADSTAQREKALPAIVAIGASAGGLEALTHVLQRLPPDPNIAVIFVQHLSPDHYSALTELLAPKTSLSVVQAASGMSIEPNHLYVIPPNAHMDVVDGRLHLMPRPSDRSQFTPIDFFFTSLARWAQSRAIGVVLSGTASDGASGIREIKACGGITIAQTPESAAYDGMPRAAIGTGLVDLILTPEQIADQITHLREHPYQIATEALHVNDIPITDAHLREIYVLLRRASRVDFKQYKTPTIKRRITRRMAVLRLVNVDAYVKYLAEHPSEITTLSHDLLIHVTRFFRDPETFEGLKTLVFPSLVATPTEDDIRVWIPGCASGEEAYSVAIALVEFLEDRTSERRIQIFATDVSERTIEIARAGTYPLSISADVSPDRLKRFFTKTDGGYRIIKMLRDMCIFAQHDLTRDPPFSRLDLVICRNVLIYLDTALQKRLMTVFHYALRLNGFLMLGSAETVGTQGFFTPADKRWRIYTKASLDVRLPFTPTPEPRGPTSPRHHVPRGPFSEVRPLHDEVNKLLLDRYGPPGVVVDQNFHVIQFRGKTGPFLEVAAGEPNLNVLKMARAGLLHPLQEALGAARKKRHAVRRENLLLQFDGAWRRVSVEVLPISDSVRGDLFLIVFDDHGSEGRPAKAGKGSRQGREREADRRLVELRRELVANRDYLQSIIQELEASNEELQSANEEILSSNEELQSTNEELDTAKEELQSMNEELNTLNEELHSRNEELTIVNSDLVNLLGSIDFPIVIVDNGLNVRRFTPKAAAMFNLIPGDIGRHIGQINPNFDDIDLSRLLRETIDHVVPQEHEVKDAEGRWHLLRIRPYKTVDNRLSGATLAMINIDGTKRYSTHVEQTRATFQTVIGTVRHPLVVLDRDLRLWFANRSFYHLFKISPTDAEGRSIVEIGDGAWKDVDVRNALDRALAGMPQNDFQMRVEPDNPAHKVRFSARAIVLDDARPAVLVAIEDKHDARP